MPLTVLWLPFDSITSLFGLFSHILCEDLLKTSDVFNVTVRDAQMFGNQNIRCILNCNYLSFSVWICNASFLQRNLTSEFVWHLHHVEHLMCGVLGIEPSLTRWFCMILIKRTLLESCCTYTFKLTRNYVGINQIVKR